MKKMMLLVLILSLLIGVNGQRSAVVNIDLSKKGALVSPQLHGVFFEEISHGGEGGLYAEMIQNRSFEDNTLPAGTHLINNSLVPIKQPLYSFTTGKVSDWKMEWPLQAPIAGWSVQTDSLSTITAALVRNHPLNKANPTAVKITSRIGQSVHQSGLINNGFWGINVVQDETYLLSFFASTASDANIPLQVSLESPDGERLASYTFTTVNNRAWTKYTCKLVPIRSEKRARFKISFLSSGTLYLDMISLFPQKTFKNRRNGLRPDLAQYIADLKPAFVRWPGGCFVEGITVENTPNWRKSIGPIESRPGTFSVWGYWSSDGFGYHEYLQFCEDIHAAALYVFNIGVSCEYRSGSYIPDEKVDSVINDILNGIEYAIGDRSSRWGKLRAANGHPKPFPLQYIEVGNEHSGQLYAKRYNKFYSAIKQKFPGIKIIASMGIGDVNKRTLDSMKTVDIADEHAYKTAEWAANHFDHFDKYKRGLWDMYVGEYATNNGVGSGNMKASLSDAIYIMSMEKNSDLVKMSSYAPLLVNVNDIDWPVNLINFNASESFARISYYLIKLFNENKPSVNVSTEVKILPPSESEEDFKGGIGFASWDTQAEYKDLEITKNGVNVYQSDFLHNLSEWDLIRGKWSVKDSALVQAQSGPQNLAVLNHYTWGNYTLTVKARKKDGYNAFIIPFAVQDSNTFMRAHIGSWLNTRAVVENVTNGYDVADAMDQVLLPHPIEQNRWYSLKLDVKPHTIACYLNDTLLMQYRKPNQVFAISGTDNVSGDIIIKVVNTGHSPYSTVIHLTGDKNFIGNCIMTSISSPDDSCENSFEHPEAFVPKTMDIGKISNNFTISIEPYSINVLRLKRK